MNGQAETPSEIRLLVLAGEGSPKEFIIAIVISDFATNIEMARNLITTKV